MPVGRVMRLPEPLLSPRAHPGHLWRRAAPTLARRYFQRKTIAKVRFYAFQVTSTRLPSKVLRPFSAGLTVTFSIKAPRMARCR